MITLKLDKQEVRAILSAVSIRLDGIRGYGLSEEEELRSIKEKLKKHLEE